VYFLLCFATPCYTSLLCVLLFSCLATPRYRTLLLSLSCLVASTFTLLCCSHYFCCLHLVAMPSHLIACFFQVPFRPPSCCFVALLFIVMLCVNTPSSLSCVNGGAWSNTNMLQPTNVLYFCLFICLFVCLPFCFKLNTFCFNVVCEF
jgi:hypothetical protein